MASVINTLEAAQSGVRNGALNGAAFSLGQWIAAGVLTQADVEDELYAAAEANGLIGDPQDEPRKTWATIRNGLSAGLQHPYDSDGRQPHTTRARA